MFICPECRSVYLDPIKRCERDQEHLVPVQANQNVRTYPLLNQELDGRYHLIGGLGQGGVGTVYLANHIHLDQLSAVKFLDVDQLGQADEEQREETLSDFVKEAKLAMLLRHDSVVRVMDYGVFEGSPFLVMEYIPGPSLLRQINSGQTFSIERCLNVIYKLADALNAFHERKLVHRDLKPANVIVDPRDNGQLTLVDLGLVKDLSTEARSSTHPLALRGTPGYLAPEQVPSWVLSSAGVEVTSDKKQIDSRVDIYALGVLAFELLTGKTPYPKGLSATKVIIHACTQDPPPIEQLRPELKDYPGLAQLVKSMMAKSPDERPLDGREVMARVAEIQEDGQEPVALREELERAQNALARRMATMSGGLLAPSATPQPSSQYGGGPVNRPSATGSLIAPPPSMTGSHQAIQIDEDLDQLLSSPQLASPVAIEGVTRQAPRLSRYEQEEEAGLETQSEDSVEPLHHNVDPFSESPTTEFSPLPASGGSGRHFQLNEPTVAAYAEPPTPPPSRGIYGVGLLLLLGGGAAGWGLMSGPQNVQGSSATPLPRPASVLQTPQPQLPLPQPSAATTLLPTRQAPFRPRLITPPPTVAGDITPQPKITVIEPSTPAPSVSPQPSPAEPPPSVKQKPAAQKEPHTSRSKRRSQRTKSSRRRAGRAQSPKKKNEYEVLSEAQMKVLKFRVLTEKSRGDIDRARGLIRGKMKTIDPKSPQFQELNILWNDLHSER